MEGFRFRLFGDSKATREAFKIQSITFTTVVAEPASLVLLGFGLAGLGFVRRKWQG